MIVIEMKGFVTGISLATCLVLSEEMAREWPSCVILEER